jgi:hypothetical protein
VLILVRVLTAIALTAAGIMALLMVLTILDVV